MAIVGLAGIFPQAATISQFWDNIVGKRNCITEVPTSRWRLEDYYDPDPSAPDKTYSRWGGFIPDVEFDPLEFGIPPNSLQVTDVSQLLALLVAKRALDDAGYGDAQSFSRERTGIVLGVGGGQKLITPLTSRLQSPVWEEAMRSSGLSQSDAHAIAEKIKLAYVPWEENSFPGMLGNVIAGRIANRLDLGGINCVVDAACASSLAALRVALAELTDGHADMMITGGVDADNSIFMYMCFSKTPAFTGQDLIKPFDAESDGMMIGEGVGMLVLKRLQDAERDSDRIYAVIRGLGSSSDGRFKSIYAPRSEGQALALERAYSSAGVPLDTVGLIEAHGTGTVAGDLVEVTTLQTVFNDTVARTGQIALGSVKSQIGHTKATAGAAGLLKAALGLHHKILPPTINIKQPHPAGNFGNSALYLNTEPRPWFRREPQVPRRAGVSSFGFGGTNYHAVLEEYEAEPRSAYRLHGVPRPLILSAARVDELIDDCKTHADLLRADTTGYEFVSLAGDSTRQTLDPASPRLGFVAATAAEAVELLRLAAEQLQRQPDDEAWDHPKGISYRRTGLDLAGRVAALFPGQGSQYVNMARDLAANWPEVRAIFGLLDQHVGDDHGELLSTVVFPPPAFASEEEVAQRERLTRTEFAQPAIGAVSAGMLALLRQCGFAPDFAGGHSFGELSALWAAGALSDTDFAALAAARGRAMAPLPEATFDSGTMLSVRAGEGDVAGVVAQTPGVVIANVNGPLQVVLSGSTEAIARAEDLLTERGLSTTRLPVSAAFHSPLVAHGQAVFEATLHDIAFQPSSMPVFANASGEPYPADPSAMADTLSRQMLQPVQFVRMVENMYAAGARLFVEVGPRNTLTNLVHDILDGREHLAVAVNPSRQGNSDRQFRSALVQLVVAGLPLHLDDPYARDMPPVQATRSPASVVINGANYVSDKTRKEYQQALENGHRIMAMNADQLSPPTHPPLPTQPATTTAVVASTPEPVPTLQSRPAVPVPVPLERRLDSLSSAIQRVAADHSATASLHQQYLRDQAEQTKLLMDLLEKQQDLLRLPGAASIPPVAYESLATGLATFHKVQAENARTHAIYLQEQGANLRAMAGQPDTRNGVAAYEAPQLAPPPAPVAAVIPAAVDDYPAPVVPVVLERPVPTTPPPMAPTPAHRHPVARDAQPSQAPVLNVRKELLAVVSDKTGYPVDTLDLDMDVEADLGIDSIKRVEIMGAMRERFPNAPALKPAELAELRTLAQIVAYLDQHSAGHEAAAVHLTEVQPMTAPPVAATTVHRAFESTDVAAQLLAVVSDKTGYPVDTLDLDMDVEADLGIDSIKRVEIMGALREQFPDAPPLKPAELAELRTLAQIVAYVAQHAAGPIVEAPSEPPLPRGGSGGVRSRGVRLKSLPPPDQLEEQAMRACCLVVDDGTELTPTLCHNLQSAGWKVTVLNLPPEILPRRATLPPDVPRLTLAGTDDSSLERQVAELEAATGRIDGIVYLHAAGPGSVLTFDESERQAVKGLFFLAKHLQPRLTDTTGVDRARPFFTTVTKLDGAFGLGLDGGEPPAQSAIAGGLFGLVKTIGLEWPSCHCRAIDLSPNITPQVAAERILGELLDPNRLVVEVGWGAHGRVTLVPDEPVPTQPSTTQ